MSNPEIQVSNTAFIKGILNNKLSRIILALLFFLFIYKIIYQIFVFFNVDPNILQMYMAWIAVLILLLCILPYKRYNL
jgi:hypothetical protein